MEMTCTSRNEAMPKDHLSMEKRRLPVMDIYSSAELYEPALEDNCEQS